MSQGDALMTKDGIKGLEMDRNDKKVSLSLINPFWPFPMPPVWFARKDVKRIPNRYHNGEATETEFGGALL